MRTIALALAFLIPQDAPRKKVICTLPVLQSIAQELGGADVEATSLSKPDQDPHFVSPTPALMKRLREADHFVELGMQLELWADEVANGSGNPKIQKGGPGRIVASLDIPREEVPKVLDRSQGDVHPEGNPHLWLDPLRVKLVAKNMAAGLKGLLPDRTAAIDERLKKFQARIDEALFGPELLKEVGSPALARRAMDGTLHAWLEEKKLADKAGGWLRKAAALRGQKVVEFHRTWIYFSKLFGFEIVGSVEPKPGIKPGPKHLQELEEAIRAKGVRVIVAENYQDLANPRHLAERTGAKVAVVPTQPGGEPGTEDALKLVDHVLDRLLEAARP
jgi:ABC-type Zn uptake system ZnuABC Zn-binding protein ZnuA